MININISKTGFVSGDAWERIGYAGERNSRTINTVYSDQILNGNEEYSHGYIIKSCHLNRQEEIMFEGNELLIPEEFLRNRGILKLQFVIKNKDQSYIFKSKVFDLYIEPSIEITESKLSDTAKNFIVVDTITDRDALSAIDLADGKVVKVNDIGNGTSKLYVWDKSSGTFEEYELGGVTEEYVQNVVNEAISEYSLKWEPIEE